MHDSENYQQAQLNQYYRQMDDIFHAYAASKGMSDSAFWILYTLCETDSPCSQNDLCDTWYYSRQTVNSAVSGLIKSGLVRLEHATGSRNRKNIVLTKEGRSYVDAHIKPLLDVEQRAFGGLTEEERNAYLHLVQKHLDLLGREVGGLIKQSSEDLSKQ